LIVVEYGIKKWLWSMDFYWRE